MLMSEGVQSPCQRRAYGILTGCEAACVHEQVAERIANVRFTGTPEYACTNNNVQKKSSMEAL